MIDIPFEKGTICRRAPARYARVSLARYVRYANTICAKGAGSPPHPPLVPRGPATHHRGVAPLKGKDVGSAANQKPSPLGRRFADRRTDPSGFLPYSRKPPPFTQGRRFYDIPFKKGAICKAYACTICSFCEHDMRRRRMEDIIRGCEKKAPFSQARRFYDIPFKRDRYAGLRLARYVRVANTILIARPSLSRSLHLQYEFVADIM